MECAECNGAKVFIEECSYCKGTCRCVDGTPCDECFATGEEEYECEACDGTGEVEDEEDE